MPDEPEAPETPGIKLEIKAYARPDGDHPIYGAVGNIAAEWAYLEHLLDSIIGHLMPRTDAQRLACLTAQLTGAAARYRVIVALIRVEGENPARKSDTPTPAEIIHQVNSLQNRTFDIAERRNRVVHDPWFIEFPDQPAQFRHMPTKNPSYGMTPVQVAFLGETYEKIVDLVMAASNLRISVYNALAAWRGIPPLPPPPTPEEMAQSAEMLKALLARLKPSPG